MDSVLPALIIKDKKIKYPIIQGGMGVGISLSPLASAVAKEGGAGIISSACLDRLLSQRNGKKLRTYDATYEEVSLAKAKGGFAGINIMVALMKAYDATVKASIDAGADFIISGAGLPLNLPNIQPPKDTALIPIVSSARALKLICKRWERVGYRPDAVVLEGPLAGGHLGFKAQEIWTEANKLENLLPPVKDMAMQHGDFPVIVAGGVYTHEDILKFLKMGADGVQMGIRFLATHESSASEEYKQAVLKSKKEDIIIAKSPGSPCGMPFRILKDSPMYVNLSTRPPNCSKGYVLTKDEKGRYTQCPARYSNVQHFCICNGLLSAVGYSPEDEDPLYTVGANAHRIKKLLSAKTLIDELTQRTLQPNLENQPKHIHSLA